MSSVTVPALCRELWQFWLATKPEFSISKGIIPPQPALDRYSLASYRHRKAFCQQLQSKLTCVDISGLGQQDTISYRMLQYYTNTVLGGEQYQQYLIPLNFSEGLDVYFLKYTLPKLPLKTREDYEYYIRLLECFKLQVEDVMELLQEGLAQGLVQHEIAVVPGLVERLRGLCEAQPEESDFFSCFLRQPQAIDDQVWSELCERAKETISQNIQTPLQLLLHFLQESYIPCLRRDISINCLPCKSTALDRYTAMLQYHCNTTEPAAVLHNLGKTQVDLVLRKMMKVMEKIGFQGTPQEYRDYLRAQPQQSFASGEEAVAYCTHIVEGVIRPQLHRLFHRPPAHPLHISIDRAKKSKAKAMYVNPSADGSVPGQVILDRNAASTLCRFEVPVLMVHEAEPGHHMQACYALEQCDLPEFRKYKDERRYFECPSSFPTNTAYTEGWGLYCEELGYELGLYEDPNAEFGYLAYELARCCRVVVDTGLHALGWSREEGRVYLQQHSVLSERGIEVELDRYIYMPAQAASYKLGHLRIVQLKEKCQEELGVKFCIKDFHDACLKHGQVPLEILDTVIMDYIQDTQAKH